MRKLYLPQYRWRWNIVRTVLTIPNLLLAGVAVIGMGAESAINWLFSTKRCWIAWTYRKTPLNEGE